MNKNNQRRLLKDVVELIKSPLSDNGIYYQHNEENMLQGHALIIGPGETLYNYGYYLFEFNFSKKYPFEPPKVIYLTNEHDIRFHPNLYRNGKVCLSLLNTWRGEQWTSCQTIRTILLNLVTLFHNKPLLNEPGIKEDYKYFKDYNRMIKFSNYNTAVLSVIKEKIYKPISQKFSDVIKENYLKNKDKILEHLIQLKESEKIEKISIGIYSSMTCYIDYNKLYDLFLEYNMCL
tara:strand:- start:2957 stop:3655 length:699 start_codon:yes stop_codon:yes gene_type:complete